MPIFWQLPMSPPIASNHDLEDHRPDTTWPVRYDTIMRDVLDRLDERNIVGTIFVVGELAEAAPDLVREVAARGHEVALHSWRHIPLTDHTPESFTVETKRGKDVLEAITGEACVGFRAPTYSLVRDSLFSVDVLGELGFSYSSSVLPGPNPLYGFPGAPRSPYLWPNGLVEFPGPLGGVGPLVVPYLGGTYLRLLPGPVVGMARRIWGSHTAPWTYCHPYDFDTDEKFWWVPDAGRMAPLLWVGRKGLWKKLDRLLANGAGPPLRARLEEGTRGGVFDPLDPSSPGRHGGAPQSRVKVA